MALPKALREAKKPERVVEICTRADLLELYEQLRHAQDGDSLAAGGVTEDMQSLQEQIREFTVTFRLEAVSRQQVMQLIAEHPPREGDVDDRAVGFNRETYHEAVVRASVVEPELSTDEWAEVDRILTPGQWTKLMVAANELTMLTGSVPFSLSA